MHQLKTATAPTSNSITGNGTKQIQNSYLANSSRLYQTFVSDEIALTYAYTKGRISSITREGFATAGDGSGIEQTYSFTYNALGQPVTTKVGSKTLSVNSYNSTTNNLKMSLYAANGYKAYTYDSLDRIKTVRYNDIGMLVTYSYDYMGNVAQKKVTDVEGTTEYATYRYEYDSLGRPVRFFETLGSEVIQQVQYTYDAKNRVTSVSYFDGAKMHTETVTYDDDAGGVVTKYDYGTDGAIGYWYDGLNRVTRKFYRRIGTDTTNGWNVYYTYKAGTATNQTTSMVSRLKYQFDASNSYTLNYTYDNIGNITEITDASGNTVGKYMYDTSGQLVLEEIGNKTKVYTYDTYGNLLRETQYNGIGYQSPYEAHIVGMDEYEYIYGYTDSDWKDLLTSYRGQTITYDAAGNPLSYYNGQSYTFTWEDCNQLASAVTGGKTVTFEYNSDGIRTEKTITNDATYYYRLNGTKVVEMEVAGVNITNTDRYVFVYDADGNPHELHYYASGATTPTKYYYVLNLQGDVIQLRDSNNAVVANYTYDAWGKLLSVTNASGATISDATHIANVNPIRYRGYFYDTETKLYYCNSRYYDPQIKRFINADESVSTGTGFLGYNMFAYCENNPILYTDGEMLGTTVGDSVSRKTAGERRASCDYMNAAPQSIPEYCAVAVFSIQDMHESSTTMGKDMAKAAEAGYYIVKDVNTENFSYIWNNTTEPYVIIHAHGSPNVLTDNLGSFVYTSKDVSKLRRNSNIKFVFLLACSTGGDNGDAMNIARALSEKISADGYVICATTVVWGGSKSFNADGGSWIVYQNGVQIAADLPNPMTVDFAMQYYYSIQ